MQVHVCGGDLQYVKETKIKSGQGVCRCACLSMSVGLCAAIDNEMIPKRTYR